MNFDFKSLDVVNNLIAPLFVLLVATIVGIFWKRIRKKREGIAAVIVLGLIGAGIVFFVRPFPTSTSDHWDWIDAAAPDRYPDYVKVIQGEIFGGLDPIAGNGRTSLDALRKSKHYEKPIVDRETTCSPEYEAGKAPQHLRVRTGVDVRIIAYVFARVANEWQLLRRLSEPTLDATVDSSDATTRQVRIVVMLFPISEAGYNNLIANVHTKTVDLLDISK